MVMSNWVEGVKHWLIDFEFQKIRNKLCPWRKFFISTNIFTWLTGGEILEKLCFTDIYLFSQVWVWQWPISWLELSSDWLLCNWQQILGPIPGWLWCNPLSCARHGQKGHTGIYTVQTLHTKHESENCKDNFMLCESTHAISCKTNIEVSILGSQCIYIFPIKVWFWFKTHI